MSSLDYTIVAVYLLAVFLVGGYFLRGQKSLTDYFLGGRDIPWWAAAFSGIATILGAVSFLGAPGQAFRGDFRFLQYRLGTLFALFLIGWVMLPYFFRMRVFSIYEYLESRFDARTRLAGSLQFFLLKLLYLAISFYAPALLFTQMTGLPLTPVILAVAVFITVYTTMGGVKAVIWTDTLQLFILLAGLGITMYLIAESTGGAGAVLQTAREAGKLRLFDTSFSFTEEYTVWNGVLGGTFVLLSQYGVNQAELQKMLTTSSIERARLALASTMICATLVGAAYFLVGAGLWVYYTGHDRPVLLTPADRIFAKFIVEELPTGFKGLLMAAVAAAAMSAASSVLNSLSTVFTADLYPRLTRREGTVASARAATFAIGAVAGAGALFVEHLGGVLVLSTKLQNFFGGSLAGIFLLGMTSSRANASGGFWGLVTGTLAVLLLANFTTVSWLWHGLFAATAAYLSGSFLSRLTTKEINPQHV
jgi:solute:Na+ symporter, SSS family